MPWSSTDRGVAIFRYTDDNPISAVHREMNRVFDGFFRGWFARVVRLSSIHG